MNKNIEVKNETVFVVTTDDTESRTTSDITLKASTIQSVIDVNNAVRSGEIDGYDMERLVAFRNESQTALSVFNDEITKEVRKSQRYNLGRIVQAALNRRDILKGTYDIQLVSKTVNLTEMTTYEKSIRFDKASNEDIYKMLGTNEASARKALQLVTDIDGIQVLIDTCPKGSEDRRVLEQYRDAMGSRPDVSKVISKADGFNVVDDLTGLPMQDKLDEAYVYDDAVTYYAEKRDGTLKIQELQTYLKKLYMINEAEPWTVNRDAVEEHDEQQARRRRTIEQVRANRKSRTTATDTAEDNTDADTTGSSEGVVPNQETVTVPLDEIEEIRTTRRELSGTEKTSYCMWYLEHKLNMKMPTTPDIKLRELSKELVTKYGKIWNDNKSKLFKLAHQDVGGDREFNQMLNVINELMKYNQEYETYENTFKEWHKVQEDVEDINKIADTLDEWLEYEKQKTKEVENANEA